MMIPPNSQKTILVYREPSDGFTSFGSVPQAFFNQYLKRIPIDKGIGVIVSQLADLGYYFAGVIPETKTENETLVFYLER